MQHTFSERTQMEKDCVLDSIIIRCQFSSFVYRKQSLVLSACFPGKRFIFPLCLSQLLRIRIGTGTGSSRDLIVCHLYGKPWLFPAIIFERRIIWAGRPDRVVFRLKNYPQWAFKRQRHARLYVNQIYNGNIRPLNVCAGKI